MQTLLAFLVCWVIAGALCGPIIGRFLKRLSLVLILASTAWSATPDIMYEAPAGLTTEIEIYEIDAADDVLVVEATGVTQETNRIGWFVASVDGTGLSGVYLCVVKQNGTSNLLASGYVSLADDELTHRVHGSYSVATMDEDTTSIDVDGTTIGTATTLTNTVTLADGAHGGSSATIELSDYSDFVGAAATAAATWVYDISGISTAGYAGDYLNNVTSTTVDVTVVGPVLETDALSLVFGDSYTDALGRRLEWSSTGWPDLTSATVVFSMRERQSQTIVMSSLSGTVVTPGVGEQTVGVEIDAADWSSTERDLKNYEYDVKATISGEIVTLVNDTATVTDKITP